MLIFGVQIKWQGSCFSEAQTTVLWRTWDMPPTDEQLQSAVEGWVLRLNHAYDNHQSLDRVARIRRVDVIEFGLEFADLEAARSRLNGAIDAPVENGPLSRSCSE